MKKFMLIYHMPAEAMSDATQHSPEAREEGMKQWFDWRDRMGDKLIDFGSPLSSGLRLDPDGSSRDSISNVAGYSIVQANDIDEVKDFLKSHPHLNWNASCDIEVHEFGEM